MPDSPTKATWIHVEAQVPPNGMVVETKIDDGGGPRNDVRLKRNGRLWFYPDGSGYVYYTPTHWRSVASPAEGT